MIQGFLLDRVDAEATGPAVSGQDDGIVFASAHKAKAALPFVQPAKARANITLHTAVIKASPVSRRNGEGGFKYWHLFK